MGNDTYTVRHWNEAQHAHEFSILTTEQNFTFDALGFVVLPQILSQTELFACHPNGDGLDDLCSESGAIGRYVHELCGDGFRQDGSVRHVPADAAGEDGDRRAKIKALEDFDKSIPEIKNIGADVLVIAGDHSTPAVLAAHSWHSVPFLINTSFTKADGQGSFSEKEFRSGSLGLIKAKSIMMLALAHAGKLKKFGS